MIVEMHQDFRKATDFGGSAGGNGTPMEITDRERFLSTPATRRIGILSYSSPGHYYPLCALGRRLQARGHEVVYFQIADLARPIEAAGLTFHQIGAKEFPLGALRARNEEASQLKGYAAIRYATRAMKRKIEMLFREAPAAIREEGVDCLLVDQIEVAGGTVAEHLGLPFVSVAVALPINTDPLLPHCILPWPHRTGALARVRNRLGNRFFEFVFSGVRKTINRQRRDWALPLAPDAQALFSKLAQITQLPAALELPGRQPPLIHHTGPWTDADARAPVDFPWYRLDPERPMVYVSMGTLQNGVLETFRKVAEACAGTDLQVVISLGGGQDPALLRDLPGDPIVVGYAPQLELIKRASLTISHGGLNTALESVQQGVPMVVLPITYDQPGVGARVEWSGVGRSIPVKRLTTRRLRDAVQEVFWNTSYRERAEKLRRTIAASDGLDRAAEVVERTFAATRNAVRAAHTAERA
jgi:UDP:flavonoid glycosyltransferase YjiC (YdhE family)